MALLTHILILIFISIIFIHNFVATTNRVHKITFFLSMPVRITRCLPSCFHLIGVTTWLQ